MRTVIILLCLGLAGCATSHPRAISSLPSDPSSENVSIADRGTVAETKQYELGFYRYPVSGRESEAAIIRVTRVPARATSEPAVAAESPSYDPLPKSTELAVELTTQREITEKIRSIETTVIAAQQKSKEQYSVLVAQSEAVAKLRAQLEAERDRLRALETRTRAEAYMQEVTPNISTPASTSSEGVKW